MKAFRPSRFKLMFIIPFASGSKVRCY
uniref:Uncharacterized protein n=1 Tax=Rhizophora mucronata TaxID=61149 RepID=A0A2P2IXB7_RHIMU